MALFSSRGPAFAEVERFKAEGLSTVEAIDRIAGPQEPAPHAEQGGGHA